MNLFDVLFFFVLLPGCVAFLVYKIARFRGGFRSQLSTLRSDDAGTGTAAAPEGD